MDTTLRSNYEKACNAYLEAFCKKHEFDRKDAEWVDVGGVANICDYYVSLADMMIDIEQDAPRGEYWKYYDYSMDCSWLQIPCPNYKNWLRGAPVKSEEELNRLKRLKSAADEARRIFENAIRCEMY
jgi:hypothetical protein